jgi:hypothetical protein
MWRWAGSTLLVESHEHIARIGPKHFDEFTHHTPRGQHIWKIAIGVALNGLDK